MSESISARPTYYPVLTIAGSDCSGGAGIQADIKAISAEGCYAMSVITAVTAQNTCGVDRFLALDPGLVEAQIRMIAADIPPLAAKTGMLANAQIIEVVAEAIEQGLLPRPVVDPVMVATSGDMLLDPEAADALRELLLPRALLVTPNYAEARALTGSDVIDTQVNRLRDMGCRNILIKGGDRPDQPGVKTDWLALDGSERLIPLSADTIHTTNTHGTGCTLSAAIAARLALGDNVETAVKRGKLYVTRALAAGADIAIGHGHGPVNHFFDPKRLKTKR